MLVKHWTKFPGRPHGRYRSEGLRVTMSPKGELYINEKAWDALGRPAFVELMFDRGRRMIGLAAADPRFNPEAFPVIHKSGTKGKIIRASAFCTHFLIKMARTGLFNEVDVENGVMTLALDTVSAVTRGAR